MILNIFFLILFSPIFFVNAQEEITLTEKYPIEICGRTIVIDGFIFDENEIKVDISNYFEKDLSPITKRYKRSDTLYISGGCTYTIASLEKYGETLLKEGKIILSNSTDYTKLPSREDKFIMKFGEKYEFGNEIWKVKNIAPDSAVIEISAKNLLVRTITLKKNDVVWFGQSAFMVTDFSKDASEIEFNKRIYYSYFNDGFGAEFTNDSVPFPSKSTQLIIRKMKYTQSSMSTEEYAKIPVKFWALIVMFYNRNKWRSMIEVQHNGKKLALEFVKYKSFDTEEEALEFARLNNITDIILDESKVVVLWPLINGRGYR